MALIDQIKNCQLCNKEFSPKKGVSYKQWLKSFWCSRSCFNSTRIGVKHTEEHNLSGENHWNWKEDRTQLAKRQERNDMAYKEWRRQVWVRDNYKCKIGNCDCKGKIIAHHILGWSLFPELRYEVNNGITLCQFHHPLKRNDEKNLSPYFQELVGVKVN